MKYLKLTRGKKAIVDDKDFAFLNQWKWTCSAFGYAYRQQKINGKYKFISMHRLILGLEKGELADHINHNRVDNRRVNLRIATDTQNAQNKSKMKNNTSGFIGVYWNKNRQYYQAYIQVNKKHIYLGKFIDPQVAFKSYRKASKQYFGEFAYQTN